MHAVIFESYSKSVFKKARFFCDYMQENQSKSIYGTVHGSKNLRRLSTDPPQSYLKLSKFQILQCIFFNILCSLKFKIYKINI